MIEVKKIVIHEIIKTPQEKKADKYFAESLIPVDEHSNASKLVDKVNKSYDDEEIVYSSFAKTDDSNFPDLFDVYNASEKNDLDFLTFSTTTLEELRKKLGNVIPAKGGYYVYAQYTYNAEEFIGIFLIRDTEGLLFKRKKDKKGFDVDTITYMNLEKLAMACRINVTRFKKNEDRYLTLIKKNQDVISDYFYEWISTSNKESNLEYTNSLYDIISLLPPPLNTLTNKPYSIDELRKDLLAYINEKKRDVNLRDIGETFYGDKEVIIQYAKDNNIAIDTSFKAAKKGLTKFRHININSDGIKAQFSQGDFVKRKVRFSEENENIVIIESEKFAKALRRELEENLVDVQG
jgi:nucleoid-associated protein